MANFAVANFSAALDANDRQVALRVGLYLGGLELLAIVQADGDLAAALDHVVVRENNARRIDDHAGTDATLLTAGQAVTRHPRHIGHVAKELAELGRQRVAKGILAAQRVLLRVFLTLGLLFHDRPVFDHHHRRQDLLGRFTERQRQRLGVIRADFGLLADRGRRRLCDGVILGTRHQSQRADHGHQREHGNPHTCSDSTTLAIHETAPLLVYFGLLGPTLYVSNCHWYETNRQRVCYRRGGNLATSVRKTRTCPLWRVVLWHVLGWCAGLAMGCATTMSLVARGQKKV